MLRIFCMLQVFLQILHVTDVNMHVTCTSLASKSATLCCSCAHARESGRVHTQRQGMEGHRVRSYEQIDVHRACCWREQGAAGTRALHGRAHEAGNPRPAPTDAPCHAPASRPAMRTRTRPAVHTRTRPAVRTRTRWFGARGRARAVGCTERECKSHCCGQGLSGI